MKVEITSARGFSDTELRHAMNCAFSDYVVPMHLSEEAFAFVLRQRGLDRDASRVALVAGRIEAIWLMGLRRDCAYLISSGTSPGNRRQGIAARLAADCLAGLRSRGAQRFRTEVIIGNTRAFELYRSLGMKVLRTLDCYDIPEPAMAEQSHPVHEVRWEEIKQAAADLCDVRPSWQNCSAAISAVAGGVRCWVVSDAQGLAGYAAVMQENGSLAQIGVRQDRRSQGIGTSLIAACHTGGTMRFVNVDSASEDLRGFMAALKAVRTVRQYELEMTL